MTQPITPVPGELSKSFEPAELEAYWYKEWESRGLFAAGQYLPASAVVSENPGSVPTYAIQFPPPNVTGTLHMGHAFNQTIMDGLIRYHRMSGDDTVLIPGTDHAGIETQFVFEKKLKDVTTIQR